MSNEEFQKIVLDEFRSLNNKIDKLELGQEEIKRDLKAVIEQTVVLTEFREEINIKVDTLLEDNKSIHQILGEHEVSIRTLRRKSI